MAKKHRDYQNDYPSVTQVLGVLRKIGLENWFKYNTAQFCNDKSSKGRLIGTQVHEAIHDYITTGKVKIETQYAKEVTNSLNSFMLFRKEHPEFTLKNSEMKMTSEKYKCNGTLDCEAEKIKPVLLDWKTGECKWTLNKKTGVMEWKYEAPPIYEEMKSQVSAYVKFHNEVANASIEDANILVLAKDKVAYNLCPVGKEEIDHCFNEIFLPALKIYNGQKRLKEGF